jgi:phospholipase/carboxylesterase
MRRRRAGSGRITRRNFLRLAGGALSTASVGFLAACSGEVFDTEENGGTLEEEREIGSAADRGRLQAWPDAKPADAKAPTGLQPLGLGSERDGLIYVPEGYGEMEAAPLALALHGAGGDARAGISPLLDLADEVGLVLLAPESRGRTWDVLLDDYGPDVEFIDRALEQTFDRLAVNPERLAVTGFSDGASYALSLGLTNGDLFTHVMAFSPGFMAPASRVGSPHIFVSHGTRDEVLPIERTSRRVVPRLERDGYEVRYREFDGPHVVPKPVAREALEWFNSGRQAPKT